MLTSLLAPRDLRNFLVSSNDFFLGKTMANGFGSFECFGLAVFGWLSSSVACTMRILYFTRAAHKSEGYVEQQQQQHHHDHHCDDQLYE